MKIPDEAAIAESLSCWKQNNPMSPKVTVNPCVLNVLFLYSLKTLEKLTENLSFLCFQGVKKGYIGNKFNVFT